VGTREYSHLTFRALAAQWLTQKSVLIGDDGDERAVSCLHDVLEALGAKHIDEQWGLAGAVEISVDIVEIDGQRLHIEQESYVGLTIRGDRDLVDRIAALVQARR
jgi:hypothetical protein